jgi:hypothetical protein
LTPLLLCPFFKIKKRQEKRGTFEVLWDENMDYSIFNPVTLDQARIAIKVKKLNPRDP